jgi:hypothetical protein
LGKAAKSPLFPLNLRLLSPKLKFWEASFLSDFEKRRPGQPRLLCARRSPWYLRTKGRNASVKWPPRTPLPLPNLVKSVHYRGEWGGEDGHFYIAAAVHCAVLRQGGGVQAGAMGNTSPGPPAGKQVPPLLNIPAHKVMLLWGDRLVIGQPKVGLQVSYRPKSSSQDFSLSLLRQFL